MSQTGVVSWSTSTGTTNGTTDSNVNWQEGMAPASVNDSARNQMASVAMWRDDISGKLVAGGTSTAYTITSNQTFSTLGYLNGQRLSFSVNTTNGAAATLNVDSLGAKALQIDSTNALPAAVFKAGQRYDVSYNSSGGYFLVYGVPQTLGAVTLGAITATSISTSGTANFAGTLTGAAINGSSVSTGTAVISSTLSVGGVATLSGGVAGLIAEQSDQETATSNTLAVSPGRQQFHPSASKCWLTCDFSGTIKDSYNVASITDAGTGLVTVTIGTDFSSAEYCVVSNMSHNTNLVSKVLDGSQGAGSVQISIVTASTNGAADGVRCYVAMFGDQA